MALNLKREIYIHKSSLKLVALLNKYTHITIQNFGISMIFGPTRLGVFNYVLTFKLVKHIQQKFNIILLILSYSRLSAPK